MASVNPHSYNVTVRQIVSEGETLFEARVRELPDARDYAESAPDAYDLAIDTIEASAAMFARDGRAFPPPACPQDDFSGRVTLRLPKSLHRRLALEAESEGASLNQHLVNVLSQTAGVRAALKTMTSTHIYHYSSTQGRVAGRVATSHSPIEGGPPTWDSLPSQSRQAAA